MATAGPSSGGGGGGGGGGCLDCLQDVVRALAMGSCLPADQRPMEVAALPGKVGGGRRKGEEAPGRIAGIGAGNVACLFTRQGKKGTNQDAMVAWEVPAQQDPFVYYTFWCFECSFFLYFIMSLPSKLVFSELKYREQLGVVYLLANVKLK